MLTRQLFVMVLIFMISLRVNQVNLPILNLLSMPSFSYFARGFAAEASANALQGLSALSAEYVPSIEEDKVVTVNDRKVDA